MLNEESLQEPLLESIDSDLESKIHPINSRKRKNPESKSQEQIAKKPKSKSKKHAENTDIDIEAGLNLGFHKMDSQLLADYIAQRTKKYQSDLSSIELEDKYIKASYITESTSWNQPRTLENLPSFLENFSENTQKLWSAPMANGTPHTIIVTGAGLRAADIARSVRKFPVKEAKVARLFAKHIKIQESIKFLQNHRTGIAIGTPQRLRDIMENGALKVVKLERIIVDVSHIDQKKRGILEMKETQVPLIAWLGHPEFIARYEADKNSIKLLFY
ncbi:hypothetical protein K3495_g7186 [Podosphaera aphanis]|nr:hypothetical protein K3495_g7186 [Podosphaera aphanis]